MKSQRAVQFLHVCDTLKGFGYTSNRQFYKWVLANLVNRPSGISAQRYAAMVTSLARGGTTWEDSR